MDEHHDLPPASVAVVLGTRPEVVKLAEVVRLLGPAARVVHTGQHYAYELARVFLDELGLPGPHVQLDIGGASRGHQIGEAIRRLDEHFAAEPPAAVVVQGDTNTVLAGAVAANARQIPLVHVEAGLRSFDRAMPEEHNRVVTDHLADLCCAPTEVNRRNLLDEAVAASRIVVTGNTVVEAVERMLPGPAERKAELDNFGLSPAAFVLATLHRPENVDDRGRLQAILDELRSLPVPVLLPVHPRTQQRVRSFGVGGALTRLITTPPLSYGRFLALAAECAMLVSDSGGIQEEASVLKRPVVVVRNSTERPEVLGTFAELVRPGPALGRIARGWLQDLAALHGRLADEPSPYGDGSASQRTVAALTALFER
ncbi:MAG: UDP-N-acetylglucosamine 2-epimerase (non-hydrolyzing) [Actinobacteria bacterium]|nr:UDP-N-acetylglucosamine 2-epimerase (non-hydrolyzing) [Actinomycetota bacterium]